MSELEEITQFLRPHARLDLKSVSVSHLLDLTGTIDGIMLLISSYKILSALIQLTSDNSDVIAKDSTLCLVNISADADGAAALLNIRITEDIGSGIIESIITNVMDENSKLADPFVMILSNISRNENLVDQVLSEFDKFEQCIEKLVTCFTRTAFNKQKQNLNYLGPVFSNLSQSSRGRTLLCNGSNNLLQRILPFTSHENSIVRRGGAVGLLKNICFDSSRHEWLLGDDIDILPFILLPLAGPEEFDEEDNEKFPIELQFLGADKKREEDPDIRKMLLESLSQLCATKKGREVLRMRGTYEILRELHKFENTEAGDPNVLLACENVVDVLIRTEEEIGEDNLKNLEIPDDVIEKINKLDTENTEMEVK